MNETVERYLRLLRLENTPEGRVVSLLSWRFKIVKMRGKEREME